MAKRRTNYEPEPHESAGGYLGRSGAVHKDTSASIFESMYRSPAYRGLTARQRDLFMCCKLQRYGKRKPGRDYREIEELQSEALFYLSWAMVSKDYGLYPEGSKKNFYSDMKALAEHGLIELVSSGSSRRTKSIYRYSTRWKDWTQPG